MKGNGRKRLNSIYRRQRRDRRHKRNIFTAARKGGEALMIENIPRIGKLPYGAKKGFIKRKGSLKERVY